MYSICISRKDLSLRKSWGLCNIRYGFGSETSFYGPNEYLLQKDDILDCVYYVSRGSMEVLDNDIVVAILGHTFTFHLSFYSSSVYSHKHELQT
jgi:hypothetical protein